MDGIETHLAAGGLVAIYGWGRFATPKSNRASTTWLQFHATGAAYVLSCLLLYALVARLLAANPEATRFLGIDPEAAQGAANLSAPLLAALLMTTLLSNVPLLQRVDAWLLGFFQRLGCIPDEVRRLSARILGAGFVVRLPTDEAFQRELEDLVGLPEELRGDLTVEPGNRTALRFTRLVLIFLTLKRWEQVRRYRGFFADFGDEFEQLAERFRGFLGEAERFFRILRSPAGNPPDAALAEYKEAFRRRMEELHRELCDFLARALLASERGSKDVNERLKELGFAIAEAERPGVDPNRLLAVTSCVFTLFLAGGSLLGSYFQSAMSVQRLIAISLMIATLYGAATFCAMLPKHCWAFADVRRVGRRPALGYAASGLLALAAAAAISALFNIVIEWSVPQGLARFALSYPWLTMSVVAAVLLALFCDDAAPPAWLRWAEGGAVAAALALASILVVGWLHDIGVPPERVPAWQFAALLNGAIGLLLGATVPHWHRQHGGVPPAADA
jgi:hypothetical protein